MKSYTKQTVIASTLFLFGALSYSTTVNAQPSNLNKGQQPYKKYRLEDKPLSGENYDSTQPASQQNKDFIADGKQRAEKLKSEPNKNRRKTGEDHEFRGGVEKSKWQEHEKQDLEELTYYTFVGKGVGNPKKMHTDDVGTQHTKMDVSAAPDPTCMQKHEIPGQRCVGFDGWLLFFFGIPVEYNEPMWGYWVPFQKVESHDIPAVSGYADKQVWQNIVKDALEKHEKTNLEKFFPQDQKVPSDQNKGSTFNIDVSTPNTELNKDAKESIENYEEEKKLRNITHESQGYRHVEFNIMNTWYHEYYKDDDRFANPMVGAFLPYAKQFLPWCHQGAWYGVDNNAQFQPIKFEVPYAFSIEPFLIGITRWISLSYDTEELKDLTPPRGDNTHTLEKVNVAEGWASTDLIQGDSGELFPAVDGDKDPGEEIKLPVGFNSTVGPFVNFASSLSPGKMAELALVRGLKLANPYITKVDNNMQVEKTQVFSLYYTEKNAQTGLRLYHPLTRFDEGQLKRDKQQHLRNERMYPGCEKLNREGGSTDTGGGGEQKEFATDWVGPEYGIANDNLEKEKNHWNTFVHWRYIQCCPWGTVAVPGIEYQTF